MPGGTKLAYIRYYIERKIAIYDPTKKVFLFLSLSLRTLHVSAGKQRDRLEGQRKRSRCGV